MLLGSLPGGTKGMSACSGCMEPSASACSMLSTGGLSGCSYSTCTCCAAQRAAEGLVASIMPTCGVVWTTTESSPVCQHCVCEKDRHSSVWGLLQGLLWGGGVVHGKASNVRPACLCLLSDPREGGSSRWGPHALSHRCFPVARPEQRHSVQAAAAAAAGGSSSKAHMVQAQCQAAWATYGASYAAWATYGASYAAWATYGASYAAWATYGASHAAWATYGASQAAWATYGASQAAWATYGASAVPSCLSHMVQAMLLGPHGASQAAWATLSPYSRAACKLLRCLLWGRHTQPLSAAEPWGLDGQRQRRAFTLRAPWLGCGAMGVICTLWVCCTQSCTLRVSCTVLHTVNKSCTQGVG